MNSRIRIALSCCLLVSVSAGHMQAQDTYDHAEYSQVKNSTVCVPSYTSYAPDSTVSADGIIRSGYKPSGIGDNWFASAGIGISSFIGSPTGCNDFFGREKFAVSLSAGKWLSPYLGVRASYDGFRFRDSQNEDYGYWGLRGDLMWNVSAYLRPDMTTMPKWDVIPFVGFGAVRNAHYGNKPFAVTPGVDVRYRIGSRLYLTGRLSMAFTKTRFDGYGDDSGMKDKMLTATLGLTVNIGGNKWYRRHTERNVATKSGYDIKVPYTVTRNEYSGLNSLRKRLGEGGSENMESTSAPASATAIGLHYFFFKKGTTKFTDSNQNVNIGSVVYFMKKNPSYKAFIAGAADSKTGTKKGNRRLAIRRAKAVRAMLIRRGISADRITVKGRGGINKYSPNPANRQTYVRIYTEE